MFHFFFKLLGFFFCIYEDLKSFCFNLIFKIFSLFFSLSKSSMKKIKNNYFCCFSIYAFSSLLLFDETTYYIFSSFYDLFFLINFGLNINSNILYFFFFYSVFFFNFLNFSGILFFFCFGLFILLNCFFFLLIFFFFAVNLKILEKIFKGPLAGLVLLSREFLAFEDEDLWVSSNIFYLDQQILESENFQIPLKAKEIEVFNTLIKLFFDVPLRNRQYNLFSGDLYAFRKELKVFRSLKQLDRERNKQLKKKRRSILFKIKTNRDRLIQDQKEDQKNLITLGNYYRTSFYKFIFKNFKFYKFPVRFKKKRLILLQKIKKKKELKSFRFSKLAILNKKFNPLTRILFFPEKRILNNDYLAFKYHNRLQRQFFKTKSSDQFFLNVVSDLKKSSINNQTDKITRFRKFLWFSFPFYLVEISYFFVFFFNTENLKRFFFFLSDWIKSKIFFYIFLFFDYSESLSSAQSEYFKGQKLSFIELLKSKNLNLFPDFRYKEFLKEADQKKKLDIEKGAKKKKDLDLDSENVLKNKKIKKRKKKLRKKEYYNVLRRKLGTRRKSYLISMERYNFSNPYNVSFIKSPQLRIINLYKLLEYFYFVLTNDSDFYENISFAAKVAMLRDKYGQAIVNDLLSRGDHKQASKVSVIMHVSEIEYNSQLFHENMPQEQKFDNDTNFVKDSVTPSEDEDYLRIRNSFKSSNPLKISPNISNFTRNLIISYRYRFRF